MTFSQTQIEELNAPLSREVVKTRAQAGRSVSYIEAWHGIAEANRIFNFDWSSETLEIKCVAEQERAVGEQSRPGWGVTYIAKVRISAGGVVHDGVGAGHGIDVNLGQAHESAIKEAESDARKRAMMQFGNPFGLALYDKTQANVAEAVDEVDVTRQRWLDDCNIKISIFDPAKDDPKKLLIWWNSPDQHSARDDFLNPVERIEMLGRLKAKLELARKP